MKQTTRKHKASITPLEAAGLVGIPVGIIFVVCIAFLANAYFTNKDQKDENAFATLTCLESVLEVNPSQGSSMRERVLFLEGMLADSEADKLPYKTHSRLAKLHGIAHRKGHPVQPCLGRSPENQTVASLPDNA